MSVHESKVFDGRCPECGSGNLEVISDEERAIGHPHPSLGYPWVKTFRCPRLHENLVVYYPGLDE